MGTRIQRGAGTVTVAIISGILILIILVTGTIWMGSSARKGTEDAVHSVSLLYLDELAGRREQVVAANLATSIRNLEVAVNLMEPDDLADAERLAAYQSRMKQLYALETFGFVDSEGTIHTPSGTREDVYGFELHTADGPDISVLDDAGERKKVVIAIPVQGIAYGDRTLVAAFVEIAMDAMLEGLSLQSGTGDATFCNIYTSRGVALTDMVLGGLAREDNLLSALKHAQFEDDSSVEQVRTDFASGQGNVVTFTYNGILETLDYVPIAGTDWMLTYLIRESVISDKISPETTAIVTRSLLQSTLIAGVLIAMFAVIIAQNRASTRLAIEKETSEAASRVEREQLEQRLELQEKLLQQEQLRAERDSMITALASDYRSVYYVDLDSGEGTCYRAGELLDGNLHEGDRFRFHETFAAYAAEHVTDGYREEFLRFIHPDTVRAHLAQASLIAFRYLATHEGKESYEMLRMAGVRHPEDRDDHIVHAVGVGFSDIDAEMRDSMARNQALSDALSSAEEANRAKTAFLSNMSHEIRTPMNAIIGLDSIALQNEDLDSDTRSYLTKIGESADHLLNLINDILDMSRIESGRMMMKSEEFSFPQLIDQVKIMFSSQCANAGITFTSEVSPDVGTYYIGDSMKLRQVLINILSNAVKFTPEGGSVRLAVERTAHFEDRSTLQFTISDTGIGISEEFLPHIFDTFSQEDSSSTNKYGSSGLGMAITKNIIEMMNGNIQVASKKGFGTTFTVTVTLRDADHEAMKGEDVEIAPHELSVLIVDDDPIACEHARLVLENVGISSEVAQSGQEAIDLVTLRHARRNPYDLLLVDWKMPNMDGVECARQIREICSDNSAIIILTAYRWDDVLNEAYEAGVDSFISKPLHAPSVIEEFKTALKARGLTGGAPKVADLANRRVLLAEDVDINAEIMSMVLEMREVTSERAVNGRVAVEMFESHPEGYYDAILMDIRMPEMDGLEATETIRALDRADAKSIPIVALTANAFDEDVQRSLQAGLNAHLTKPVQPESLFETLENLIRD